MRESQFVRALRFEERSELERWALSGDEDQVRRARIVLLSGEGKTVREIAEAVGSHPINVRKWIQRFNAAGISGLNELKRGPKKGARSRFGEDSTRAILDLAVRSPRELGFDFDTWSPQKLADAAVALKIVPKISHVTVRAMLREAGGDRRSNGNGAKANGGVPAASWSAAGGDGVADEVAALMGQGEQALERSDNRAAAASFRAALELPGLQPVTEAVVRCKLSQALENLASYDEALDVVRKYDEASALPGLPLELRGRVKIRLGWVYSWLRNFPRAIARLNEGLKLCREIGDDEGLADAHFALGRTYMQFDESSMARDHLERAIALKSDFRDSYFLAQVYLRLGVVEFNEGNIDRARDVWEQARQLAEGGSDDNLIGHIYLNLGVARMHADRGERDMASRDLERAIVYLERGGKEDFLARTYNNLGDNLRFAGEWSRAIEVLHRAIETGRDIGDARYRAEPLVTLGEIAFRQGRYDDAHQKLSEALELMRNIEDRWGEAYTLRVLGGLYHRMHQPLQALRTLREALHLSTVIKDLRGVTLSHLLLAELHIADERYEQAGEYIELALGSIKSDPSQLRYSGLARRLSGQLEMVRGRYAESQQQLAQSISIFTAVADVYEVGLSHLEMAELMRRTGDEAQLRAHLDAAVEIFERLGAAPDLERALRLRESPKHAAAAPAAGAVDEHRGSDVLLMQRLIDASASRDLLMQELASVLEENFSPGRLLMLEQGEDALRPEVVRGMSASEAETLTAEIEGWISAGGRATHGAVYILDARAGANIVLYVNRPAPADRLRPLLRQAELGLENCALREMGRRPAEPIARGRVETVIPGFIFAGGAMREVVERIHKIRTSDVTVLITGESGTGKELVARAIHAESERRRAAFLPFNCTATPKEIIDSQLFGHRRGAFTGATSNYPGITRAAEGGTLFLDEIGDLALEVQPKLLRFLESGEIQPLGETRPHKVDVRVVAATNTDLERAVEEGRFREDLFHRLNIIRIHVPPLRERREEIAVLAEHFLSHFAQRSGKGPITLTDDAFEALTRYGWPGNVRQLRNEMERVVAYATAGARVSGSDLSPELRAGAYSPQNARAEAAVSGQGHSSDARSSLRDATARFERQLIEEALSRFDNDISRAAVELGLSRRGLAVRMAQLGIARNGLLNSF